MAAYGQIQGHSQHHKFKAAHHDALAKLHAKAAAHHKKMAGETGETEPDPEDAMEGEENEPSDTVQNFRPGMSFGRGPR